MKNNFLLLASTILLASCSKLGTNTQNNSSPSVTAEVSECTTSTVYSSPVTITGTARLGDI